MGRGGKERLLMTNAKVHFILGLNLNSEEKRGRGRMAAVINESETGLMAVMIASRFHCAWSTSKPWEQCTSERQRKGRGEWNDDENLQKKNTEKKEEE